MGIPPFAGACDFRFKDSINAFVVISTSVSSHFGQKRACGSRELRRPAGSTQKGPWSASPIERITTIFTAWKERQTFDADNSPTPRSHENEQVCHNGLFGMDKGQV
jgi:hypothetical protein